MLTVIYSKGNAVEAAQVAAATKPKSKGNKATTSVALVSLEQLKAWNSTASNLHVFLAEALSVARALGKDAATLLTQDLTQHEQVFDLLLQNLHYLKAVLKDSPETAAIGWQLTDSELLTLLATVLRNMYLIPTESTFLNSTLTDVMLAICDETLDLMAEPEEEILSPLNG